MGVASGCGEQEVGVASGSGWNLWMWLLGVVVRRYIDFLILLIPTPLVSVLFCSSIPTSLFIFKNIDYSVFRLHIYVISKWLLTQLTHAPRKCSALHSTCTSYVLNTYLYCVYALVGGAISIRDPYICAVSRVCAKESHAVFHRPVVCAVKT